MESSEVLTNHTVSRWSTEQHWVRGGGDWYVRSGVKAHHCIFSPSPLQVHGHHPPSAAAHVVHWDQGGGGSDLGAGSAPCLPPVLLLHHARAPRPGGVLHRLAWIHHVRLQKDVSLSAEPLISQSTSAVNYFWIGSKCGRMLFVFSVNERAQRKSTEAFCSL